jgi:predicted lipoprotein with Yx(FWY)xxD motif
VTDSKGYVLYRFDADSAHPTRVSCYGTCAVVWPAATAKGSVTVKGIDKSLVSTVKRSGGTSQLTLAGWPLYRYAKDDQPKEAYGQGVGGTWWAVTPTGAKATTATASSTGGGY